VNPLDTRSIADALEKIHNDAALAQKLRAAGLEQSAKFNWDTAAAKTLEFYRQVAGR